VIDYLHLQQTLAVWLCAPLEPVLLPPLDVGSEWMFALVPALMFAVLLGAEPESAVFALVLALMLVGQPGAELALELAAAPAMAIRLAFAAVLDRSGEQIAWVFASYRSSAVVAEQT
jgi:hypothetical protein